MMPSDAREIALMLEGAAIAIVAAVVFAALALWLYEVRRAIGEGELSGEELERNRRREESR